VTRTCAGHDIEHRKQNTYMGKLFISAAGCPGVEIWVLAATMAVKPVGYNLMRRLYSVLYLYYLPYYPDLF
jgi:hypothetical protein